jgi:hypothetical protein
LLIVDCLLLWWGLRFGVEVFEPGWAGLVVRARGDVAVARSGSPDLAVG